VKNGVPFNVAFSIEDEGLLAAMVITFGELEGGEFDWEGMVFKKPRGSEG
jgi:hypothetical protein